MIVVSPFLVVAGYFLYLGGKELRATYHVFTNDTVPIRDLRGYSGPAVIEGAAVPRSESNVVTAPFTGTECLAYTYEFEELSDGWATLDEGADHVAFFVEDETGRVRVDPRDADLRLDGEERTVPPRRELPEEIAAFVESSESIERQGTSGNSIAAELIGNDRRFTEGRLDIGETVYVYGEARSYADAGRGGDRVDAAVRDGPDVPGFVVSDSTQRGTAWRFAKRGLSRLAYGVAFLLGPLVFVLLNLT